MIVKKIARKSQGNFHQLAQYILREDQKNSEIGRVRISNCNMIARDLAVKEIEATQARNTRSKADKTCHLIVSFPTGETPTTAQFEDIENAVCSAIGLGDHQRLSVVHLDTEHNHMHIAINKIHPVSHRNVELIRDHFKLAEACERLEARHQLARDNHPQRFADHQRSAGVGEMAAHGDRVPFHDWAITHKQALGEALNTAATWDDLHRALALKGIEIKPRGAGLVLAAKGQSAHIKASALGREFSAAKLTARFGAYQAPTPELQNLPAQVSYTPTRSHDLWADYQRERQKILADKKTALAAITDRRASEAEAIKAEMADKRAQVFNSVLLTKQQKRALYLSLSAQRKTRYAGLSEHTAQARQAARTEHPVPNWRAWLRARTDQGDRAAERALERAMRKDAKHPKQANRKRTAHQALASEPPPTQGNDAQWDGYQDLASEPPPIQDSDAQWEDYQDLASEPPPTQGSAAQWDGYQDLASEPPPIQDSDAQWEDYQALASEPPPTQGSAAQWDGYQDLASEPPPIQGSDAQWDGYQDLASEPPPTQGNDAQWDGYQALASEPPPIQDSDAQWEDYQALASEPPPTQGSAAQWDGYQDLASEPPPIQGSDAQWDGYQDLASEPPPTQGNDAQWDGYQALASEPPPIQGSAAQWDGYQDLASEPPPIQDSAAQWDGYQDLASEPPPTQGNDAQWDGYQALASEPPPIQGSAAQWDGYQALASEPPPIQDSAAQWDGYQDLASEPPPIQDSAAQWDGYQDLASEPPPTQGNDAPQRDAELALEKSPHRDAKKNNRQRNRKREGSQHGHAL